MRTNTDGVPASPDASAWWALVMCAAASIEDAANCLRDPDAKKQAEGAAKHYREAAQKLWATRGVMWQPMNTAPKKHGAEVIGWFRKVKLDEEGDLTDEVVGGAMAQVSRNGDGWTEPDWLDASGAYFFDDFSFEIDPVLWHPLPPEPTADELAHVPGAEPQP